MVIIFIVVIVVFMAYLLRKYHDLFAGGARISVAKLFIPGYNLYYAWPCLDELGQRLYRQTGENRIGLVILPKIFIIMCYVRLVALVVMLATGNDLFVKMDQGLTLIVIAGGLAVLSLAVFVPFFMPLANGNVTAFGSMLIVLLFAALLFNFHQAAREVCGYPESKMKKLTGGASVVIVLLMAFLFLGIAGGIKGVQEDKAGANRILNDMGVGSKYRSY